MADPSIPAVVYDLLISANEFVANLGSKVVTVTFKKHEPNTLFVSDYDRIWVEGKAAEIKEFLRDRESKAARFLRTHGPNLNSLIFLLLLWFLPSIHSLRQRFQILAATFALLFLLLYSWRLAVNSKISLREPKLSWYQKYENIWIAVMSVLLSALIVYLIERYLRQ